MLLIITRAALKLCFEIHFTIQDMCLIMLLKSDDQQLPERTESTERKPQALMYLSPKTNSLNCDRAQIS